MKRVLAGGFVLVLLGAALIPAGEAQHVVHDDHFLTFETPVLLPNGVVLRAGTYLFKFPNEQRELLQIASVDQAKLFATLQTFPARRAKAEGFEVVVERTSPHSPPRLKAWYCAGNQTGHQFEPPAR